MLLDKRRALYVKCCIIPNGIEDTQGDTLYGEDIKKIFTSFNNQDNFEIYHESLPLQEVSLLENYISTADESIGNRIAPAGSWNATVRVDNPDIQNGLLTSEFGGVSLNNRIAPRCKGNLKGTIRYKDVADAECVIPLFISFVERGANGFGLHVMDYDAFIKKSQDIEFGNEDKKIGGQRMKFDEFLTGLKSLIKQAEDTPEEEPAIEKEDEKTKEKEVVETPTEEPVKETTEEEPVVKKEDETAEEKEEEKEDEPTIEKEDGAEEPVKEESDFEARIAKLEEIVAKLVGEEETPDEEDGEEETEKPEDEDTPKITKSAKVIVEDKTTPQPSNYYEMSGRDPDTGIKIRN